MSDYLNGVIYKLHKDDICYIGSTKDKDKREENHKNACNNENHKDYNYKVYQHIRENGGMDTWTFKVIEKFPCENETQLRIREQYYYDLMKPLLNSQRPYVSEEELKKYHKNYSEKWYKDNIEVIAKKYQDNREEIAKKYQDNREEMKEKNAKNYAKYYEKNQEKLKHKHICECGGKYTHQNNLKHCKGKKHIAFFKNR